MRPYLCGSSDEDLCCLGCGWKLGVCRTRNICGFEKYNHMTETIKQQQSYQEQTKMKLELGKLGSQSDTLGQKFDLKLAQTLIPNKHLIKLKNLLEPTQNTENTIEMKQIELYNIISELLIRRDEQSK